MANPLGSLKASCRTASQEEVDQIISLAEDYVFASEQSIDRSLALGYKTETIAIATLHDLKRQNEQKKAIQDDINRIQDIQKSAARQITITESLVGQLHMRITPEGTGVTPVNKKVIKQQQEMQRKADKAAEKKAKKELKEIRKAQKKNPNPKSASLPPETRVLSTDAQEALRRTDEKIEKLHDVVKNLKDHALGISEELNQQNVQDPYLSNTSIDAAILQRENIHRISRQLN